MATEEGKIRVLPPRFSTPTNHAAIPRKIKNLYRRGADFERLVRSDLQRRGYLVLRAAGSKGAAADGAKIDILALYPCISDKAYFTGEPLRPQCHGCLLVQCKLSGTVTHVDKYQLIRAARKYGCAPVIATKTEQGIEYDNLPL